MIKNYFKIALRNIVRNKVFSLINIFGLAIGIAVSIIIMVYVKHELSYDKFHDNYKNIYRMGISQAQEDNIILSAITSPPMGPDLYNALPEFKKFVRISTPQSGIYTWNNENYESDITIYADSTFFDVFSFELLSGDKNHVLDAPNSVVLSESFANKIFKNAPPVGKQLILDTDINATVTGIVKDPPTNSHLKFDALVSFNTFSGQENFYNRWDGNFSFYTYLEMDENINIENLKPKTDTIFYEKLNKKLEPMGWKISPFFEPLKDLYLRSKVDYNFYESGSIKTVYIFIIIAFFILAIACVNFMNLSTALVFKRTKEVAVRKVAGASRKKILGQFLYESAILSLIAMIFALIFIETLLPTFNHMFNKELKLYTLFNLNLLLCIPAVIVLAGIISGLSPAFIMSGFKPVNLMRGLNVRRNRKFNVRNILVVFQFVISIVLIIATTIIYFQIHYLTNKGLGFDSNNLVVVTLHNKNSVENSDLIRDRFLQDPNIINSTVASAFPATGLTQNGYQPEGVERVMMFHALYVDYNYVSTMGMEIVKGRDFDPQLATDADKLLINETLAKELGWDKPIGKYIERNGKQEVICVVKDFHFNTLHDKIRPVVFTMLPRKAMIISRIKEKNKEVLQFMENEWKEITGDNTFNYFFVSDVHEKLYRKDQNFGEIILAFAILAVFIACMGLFGLSAFITLQRTKEIGIRRVLGAMPLSIHKLLLKHFIFIVLIAMAFAWPIAYYGMNKWLQNYAYKINMHLGYFVLASLIALIVAYITLSYHTLRASRANPVDSLKYE